MAAAMPDAVEHPLERQVAGVLGHVIATGADRYRLFHEEGFAVGHQQLGAVGHLGQAGAQSGDDAQTGGEQFAIAAPHFGGGDDHQFSQGELGGTHGHTPQKIGRGRLAMRSAPPLRSWYWASLQFRSEESTSELQSRPHLVCRLLLEKKNSTRSIHLVIRQQYVRLLSWSYQ